MRFLSAMAAVLAVAVFPPPATASPAEYLVTAIYDQRGVDKPQRSIQEPGPLAADESTAYVIDQASSEIWKLRHGLESRLELSGYSEARPLSAAISAHGLLVGGLSQIWRIDVESGSANVLGGLVVPGFRGDSGAPVAEAAFSALSGLANDYSGNVVLADQGNNLVRSIGTNLGIHTVAGTGQWGVGQDGRQAKVTPLAGPQDVTVRSSGSLLVAEADNARVREIGRDGLVSTVAGGGVLRPQVGLLATHLELEEPAAVATFQGSDSFALIDRGASLLIVVAGGVVDAVIPTGGPACPPLKGPGTLEEVRLCDADVVEPGLGGVLITDRAGAVLRILPAATADLAPRLTINYARRTSRKLTVGIATDAAGSASIQIRRGRVKVKRTVTLRAGSNRMVLKLPRKLRRLPVKVTVDQSTNGQRRRAMFQLGASSK